MPVIRRFKTDMRGTPRLQFCERKVLEPHGPRRRDRDARLARQGQQGNRADPEVVGGNREGPSSQHIPENGSPKQDRTHLSDAPGALACFRFNRRWGKLTSDRDHRSVGDGVTVSAFSPALTSGFLLESGSPEQALVGGSMRSWRCFAAWLVGRRPAVVRLHGNEADRTDALVAGRWPSWPCMRPDHQGTSRRRRSRARNKRQVATRLVTSLI
jgi:hypothetical protein